MSSKSTRLLKKRRNRIIIRTTLIVVGFCIAIALPFVLLNLHVFLVRDVAVSGNAAVDSSEIIAVVKKDIEGRYGHIVPKSNVLFYPKHVIETDIADAFPRVLDVKVDTQNLHTTHITIKERTPEATWCENGDCYFVDETGEIFDHAPLMTGPIYFEYSGGIDATTSPIGMSIATAQGFADLQTLIAQVKKMSLDPQSIKILPQHEFDMKLATGEDILFSSDYTVDQTITNLESVFADPTLRLRSSGGLSFTSLDLRYGNKVFFKKKADAK